MNSLIDAARILISLLFLTYSSWQDIKKREVSNNVWLIFVPIGLSLSFLEVLLGVEASSLIFSAISIMVITGLSFGLFYLGFFGGADAKALICLSIVMPAQPAVLKPYFSLTLPIFSLSVLINAIFASLILVLGIIVYNISRYLRTDDKFFAGLEGESSLKKIILFITGIKVDLGKIRAGSHYIPLETIFNEDGKLIHRLHLFPKINEVESEDLTSLSGLPKEIDGGVWVTPSIPLLFFVTIGFFITLFLGDVFIGLMISLFMIVI